jgi:Flp pilus assembly protein TadG
MTHPQPDFSRSQNMQRIKAKQRGTSLVEFSVILTFILIPLFLLAVDFGRGYFISIEVSNAARAGAQYALSIPNATTTNIQTAATNDAPELTGMTAVAVTGCMCSDSSSQQAPCGATPPSCTGSIRLINYVQVDTTYTYTPLFNPHVVFSSLPSTMTIHGHALFPTGT